MTNSLHRSSKKQEAGVALLLSIFVLLVISVVAISMIVASGTESSLAGNYRTSTSAYYAALAGLEEGRGRMLAKSPNFFNNTVANFIPSTVPQLGLHDVRYILNPASGETVSPTGSSSSSYPDTEYASETGLSFSTATVQTITSTSALATTVTPPLYKWVRITPATERSVAGDGTGRDVNNDGTINSTNLLYYDSGLTPPRLIVVPTGTTPPSSAQQVFKVTALAVLPNKSEKLLQYTIAAKTFNLNFPSALTVGASSVAFNAANSSQYQVDGIDGSGNPPAVPGCTPGAGGGHAIGTTSTSNVTSIDNGIPGYPCTSGGNCRPLNYTGTGGVTPDVSPVAIPSTLDTPADAYQTVQKITAAADLVISGNATQVDMPTAMSQTNPMTVVVNGDFSMSGNFTGYGLLVVTGNFSYTGTTGWKGIVLVVGDGTAVYNGTGGGNNEFDGAIYVSTIWDSNHNLLTSFGPVTYNVSGGGGNGVYYNSCWITSAQQPSSYTVLSFREIPYNQ
jgi:hypothetical protein